MNRCIVIDDEKNGREILRILIEKFCPELELVATASTRQEGIEKLIAHQPQIVFLDIELDQGTGFDILADPGVRNLDFKIIFTTAYEQYALKAIKNDALDYLLKPIDHLELKKAIAKAKQKENIQIDSLLKMVQTKKNTASKIKLVNRGGFDMVAVSSIVYCKSEINYTRFYMKDGTNALTSKTLKSYQTNLEASKFLRVHKSHLINLSEVRKYIQGNGGQVLMSNGTTLEVSKSYKHLLIEKLNDI